MSIIGTLTKGATRAANKKPAPVKRPVVSRGQSGGSGFTKPIAGPGADNRPFVRQRRQQQNKVTRARRSLPARPVPAIPNLRNPTRAQSRTAANLINRSVRAQAGITGPARSKEQVRAQQRAQRQVLAEMRARADTRRRLAVAQGVIDGRFVEIAATAGKQLGVKGSRAQQAQAGAQWLKQLQEQGKRDRIGPKQKKGKVGGFLPLADLTTGINEAVDRYTSLNKGDAGPRNFAKAALGDVAALGTGPVIAGYVGGMTAFDLARSGGEDTKRLEELARGLKEGVNQSVPVRLAVGDWKGAEKSFLEHPVFAALDVAGVASGGGRVAGALARGAGKQGAGGVRGKLADVGDVRRPSVALVNDATAARAGMTVERRYPKSLARKMVAQLNDATREPLLDPRTGKVVTVRQGGKEIPVLRARESRLGPEFAGEQARLQRKRGDFVASRANALERVRRDQALGRELMTDAPSRRGRAAASVREWAGRPGLDELRVMVVDGTIRTAESAPADLKKRAQQIRSEIAVEGRHKTRGEIESARKQAALLERMADHPKLRRGVGSLMAQGVAAARELNTADAKLVEARILDPQSARRAALTRYAVTHMGARHFSEDEHLALEATLRQSEEAFKEAAARAPKGPAREEALRAWREAREKRLLVSGRDPVRMREFEDAHAADRRAVARVKKAKAKVATAELRLAKVRGRAQSRGGERSMLRMQAAQKAPNRARAVTAFIAEAEKLGAKGVAKERKNERQLREAKREVAAARAELAAANKQRAKTRERRAKTSEPPVSAAIRHGDGRLLSTREIEEHARGVGRDPDTIAFVQSKLEGEDAKGAYHAALSPQAGRANFNKQRLTGSLFARGATDHERQLLRDEFVRKAVHLTKTEQIDKAIGESGVRHPAWDKNRRGEPLTAAEQKIVKKGGYFTGKEAVEEARRLNAEAGKQEWIPVRAFAAKLSEADKAAVRGKQNPTAHDSLHEQLFNSRLDMDDTGARNVVLQPAEYVTQLMRHAQSPGGVIRFFQFLNRPFRMAVLPQPRWLTGNFVEPYVIRLTLSGAGVNVAGLALDITAGRKLLRQMERSKDPKVRLAAEEVRAQQAGGLFIGRRGADVQRTFEDLPAGSRTRQAVYAGHVVRNLPVVKQLADMVLAIPKAFFRFNRVIESNAQFAALGKLARDDIQALHGSWLKSIRLSQDALEDVGRGLVGTPAQQRFMRAQHEMLGQYEGFPPWLREWVQGPMPFLPWSLAAARFVFWTLPVKNTLAEAVLMKTQEVYADGWEEAHSGALGTLKFAQVTEKGGLVDFARYTPFGLSVPLTQGNLEAVTAPLLPQLSGPISALRGKDPFGRDLQLSSGKEAGLADRLLAAGQSLGEATIPMAAQARRIREGGGTGFADSTLWDPKVKPGSDHMSGLRRTLDPFRPTYLKNAVGGGFGGGGPISNGGSGSVSDRELEQAITESTAGVASGPSEAEIDALLRSQGLAP